MYNVQQCTTTIAYIHFQIQSAQNLCNYLWISAYMLNLEVLWGKILRCWPHFSV